MTNLLCRGSTQRRITILMFALCLSLWTSFGAVALASGWVDLTPAAVAATADASRPTAASVQPAPATTIAATSPVATSAATTASNDAASASTKTAPSTSARAAVSAKQSTEPAPAARPAATVAPKTTTVAAGAARAVDLTVVSETWFTNTGTEMVSSGTATMALRAIPQSRDLVLLGETISPAPVKVTQDAAGNRVAEFDLGGLAPGQGMTVRQEYQIRVWGYGGDGTDGEVLGAHLQAEKKIEVDAPVIQAMAQRLTSGQDSVEGKLASIFAGTRSALKYSASSPACNKGALAALNVGSGVCEEYASLFVALCRAAGIPSRLVIGYGRGSTSYDKAWTPAPNNLGKYRHAWAETYVPGYGWATFDPTLNRATVPGIAAGQIPSGTLIAESYRNRSMSTAYVGGRVQANWQQTVTW